MSNEAMREAFETYMSGDGRFPKAVERDGSGGYLLGTARTGWADWQAAWRAACEHCATLCETSPTLSYSEGVAAKPASELRSLLARIHRDGGHYLAEHGLDKALEDADAKVVAWIQRDDATPPSQGNDSAPPSKVVAAAKRFLAGWDANQVTAHQIADLRAALAELGEARS